MEKGPDHPQGQLGPRHQWGGDILLWVPALLSHVHVSKNGPVTFKLMWDNSVRATSVPLRLS